MILKDGKKYKMDKKAKTAWVEALRSGKYRKIKGTTGCGKNRCALGVAAAEGLTKVVFGAYVPKTFLHSEAAMTVGRMNDTGKSFKRIADWIEENL